MFGIEGAFQVVSGAILVLVFWALAYSVVALVYERRLRIQAFVEWQNLHRRMLDQVSPANLTSNAAQFSNGGTWSGWRQFKVAQIIRESFETISIRLNPADGKEIPRFLPGQFVAIRVKLPNSDKATVRCYSLSDTYSPEGYRITVKRKSLSVEHQPASLSHFLVNHLMVGDLVELQPPAGDFYIDVKEACPLVLIAAGVGITPLLCMAKSALEINPEREVLLVYGNKNRESAIFLEELRGLQRNPNFHLLNCFSDPQPQDVVSRAFQVRGRVSLELLQQVLPNQQFKFYLCGPAAFMESLVKGLLDWGVLSTRIHFEAFGPQLAWKSERDRSLPAPRTKDSVPSTVVFKTAEGDVEGEAALATILELAEELKVELSSGCRSGNCGTCAVRVLRGQVAYPGPCSAKVDPGYCLACVARPVGHVEIET